MSADVRSYLAESVGEVARRAEISSYHVLQLPITASREDVLARVEALKDYIHNNWRNSAKREVGKSIDRDFLQPILEQFSDVANARAYRDQTNRRAEELRQSILRFASEKKLSRRDAEMFLGGRYALVAAEIPNLLDRAELSWRSREQPASSRAPGREAPMEGTVPGSNWVEAFRLAVLARAGDRNVRHLTKITARSARTMLAFAKAKPRSTFGIFGAVVATWFLAQLVGGAGIDAGSHVAPPTAVHTAVKSGHGQSSAVVVPITVGPPHRKIAHRPPAHPRHVVPRHGSAVVMRPGVPRRNPPSSAHLADDLAKKLDP
jgi:hypothetical protein